MSIPLYILIRLVRENENVMVEFFAPWCPACVTFLPHLETLKDSNAGLPLKVVKVFDADHVGADDVMIKGLGLAKTLVIDMW